MNLNTSRTRPGRRLQKETLGILSLPSACLTADWTTTPASRYTMTTTRTMTSRMEPMERPPAPPELPGPDPDLEQQLSPVRLISYKPCMSGSSISNLNVSLPPGLQKQTISECRRLSKASMWNAALPPWTSV